GVALAQDLGDLRHEADDGAQRRQRADGGDEQGAHGIASPAGVRLSPNGVRGLRFLVRRRPTSSPAQREKKAPRTGAAPAAQVLARKMRASRDAVALTPAPERRLAPPCAGYASPAGAGEEITPPRSSAPGSPDRCAIGAAG